MKLAEGTHVYIGRKKFVGEIPDALAPKHLLEAEKEHKKNMLKKKSELKDKG